MKFRLSARAGGGSPPPEEDARLCRQVLAAVFDATLRLLHPVCPFITEELWHLLAQVAPRRGLEGRGWNGAAAESAIIAPWPMADPALRLVEVEKTFGRIQEAIQAVRRIRQERNLSSKDTPEVLLDCASAAVAQSFEAQQALIRNLGAVASLNIGAGIAKPEGSVSEIFSDFKIFIPVPKANLEKEKQALLKRKAELENGVKREEQKLQNPSFVEKAPPAVVEAARKRIQELLHQLETVNKLIAAGEKS